MSRDKLAELEREALIELIMQQAQQIGTLQAEIEVLRKKLEKGKKPPRNSGNSSQLLRGIKKGICHRSAKSADTVRHWGTRNVNASSWRSRIMLSK